MSYIREFATMDNILFFAYLIWMSVQDLKDMKIARYTHILGMVAVLWSAFTRGLSIQLPFSVIGLCETVVIFFLEIAGYFLKCYGFADVIAICICSLFYYFQNGGYQCLLFYFLLYAISGILVVIIQFAKGNIKGLRLKQPVPYIPYISVAFFLTKWVL